MLAPLSLLVTRWTLAFDGLPPPITANQLRGACLIRYRRAVCPPARFDDDCAVCPLLEGCSYGQVFAARPLAFAALSGNERLPRPYLFRPDLERRDAFTLTLVGQAAALLPRVVRIFADLGRRGLGVEGPPFRVDRLERLTPGGASPLAPDSVPSPAPADQWMAVRPRLERVRLRFLAATSLRDSGRPVERPLPGPVLRRLRDRLSSLAGAWCGGQPAWDFRRLGQLADEVRLEHDETRWRRQERRSGRSHETFPTSGFVGGATWAGVPEELWPLLVAGELLGVGKGCVFGNGWYRLEDAG